MGTGARPPVVEGEVVVEGTSLFHRRTREVAWVTDVRDGSVNLETVTGSFAMETERFEQRVADGAIVVEARPTVGVDGTTRTD